MVLLSECNVQKESAEEDWEIKAGHIVFLPELSVDGRPPV